MTEFHCNCNRYQDCSGIALPPNPVYLSRGNGLWRFVVCRNCALPLKEMTAVTRFARLSSKGPYQCIAVVREGRAIFIDFSSLKRPRKLTDFFLSSFMFVGDICMYVNLSTDLQTDKKNKQKLTVTMAASRR